MRWVLPWRSAPPLLRFSLLFVVCCYAVNLGLLCFLIGPNDHELFSTYYELAWRFWMTQHGAPSFNPFLFGGMTLGADPQIPIYSPIPFLVGVLGAGVVLRLEFLLQCGLGAWGMWHFVGRFVDDSNGRLWALLLYLGGGGVVARVMVGHVTLGSLLLLPLLLELLYRVTETSGVTARNHRVLLWLVFIYSGNYKPHLFLYTVPLLALEALGRAVIDRSIRPLRELALASVISALANAPTFLPAWQYFRALPRHDAGTGVFVPFYVLVANLLLPLKSLPERWYGQHFFQRHEYNVFIGPVGVGLAAIGALRFWRQGNRRLLPILLVGAFSILMGMGTVGEGLSLWPFSWFKAFWPGFSTNRVPVRFWYSTYLALILLSAVGFTLPRSRGAKMLLFLFGVLPLLGSAAVNISKLSYHAKQTQWSPPRSFQKDPHLVDNDVTDQYRHIRGGSAILRSNLNLEIRGATDLVNSSLLTPQFESEAEAVLLSAEWLDWSHIRFQATGGAPFRLRFNLNHAGEWTLDGRGAVQSKFGDRLTIASDGNHAGGVLTYHQPWIRTAKWLALLATFFVIGYALRGTALK